MNFPPEQKPNNEPEPKQQHSAHMAQNGLLAADFISLQVLSINT